MTVHDAYNETRKVGTAKTHRHELKLMEFGRAVEKEMTFVRVRQDTKPMHVWAAFLLESEALEFADTTRRRYPTWTVVVDTPENRASLRGHMGPGWADETSPVLQCANGPQEDSTKH